MDGSDLLYSLEDLKLVAKGDLMELTPGRRVQLILGGVGSLFRYRAVVLDAQPQSLPYSYHCGVLLVPKVSSCSTACLRSFLIVIELITGAGNWISKFIVPYYLQTG